MQIEDRDRLEGMFAPPANPEAEPIANFPLPWYEEFLQRLVDLEIEVITYRDLFDHSDDRNYRSNYKREFINWRKRVRDRKKRYLLIQHDVDNQPFFTKRIVAMEAVYGVRSNIFIFRQRYSKARDDPPYEIDHEFFQEAQRRGFVIGYHQNALPLADFDPRRAVERYRSDVEHLRRLYDISFVVPHGGVGVELDDRMIYNLDVPIPAEFEQNLRWVYNGHGVRFADCFSDGGLRKTGDPKRIRNFNLVGRFLTKLKPGTRNFCLIHPQRWGYNVDPQQNPMLAEAPWYKEILERYR